MTKPTKWHVRPAKTRISLGICLVWSVFAVRMKKAWVVFYPLSAQRRLWLDRADAQADLSLHWAHSNFVGFVMRWLLGILHYCNIQKHSDSEKNWCNNPKIRTLWFYHTLMCSEDVDWKANSVDPDQTAHQQQSDQGLHSSSLIKVCTVCLSLSVWTLWIITVYHFELFCFF